jgi:hypothetical protein
MLDQYSELSRKLGEENKLLKLQLGEAQALLIRLMDVAPDVEKFLQRDHQKPSTERKPKEFVCGYCGIHILPPDQKSDGKCQVCVENDRREAQKAD